MHYMWLGMRGVSINNVLVCCHSNSSSDSLSLNPVETASHATAISPPEAGMLVAVWIPLQFHDLRSRLCIRTARLGIVGIEQKLLLCQGFGLAPYMMRNRHRAPAAQCPCQAEGQKREVISNNSVSVTSSQESQASTRFRRGRSEEGAGARLKLSFLLPCEPNIVLKGRVGSFPSPFLLLGGHRSRIAGSCSGVLG